MRGRISSRFLNKACTVAIGGVALLLLTAAAVTRAPQVDKSGLVTFANGRRLRYEASKKILRSVEDAESTGRPVAVQEQIVEQGLWRRLFVLTTWTAVEEDAKELRAYDFDGNRLARSPRFMGRVFVLEKARRIIADGRSSHFLDRETLLLDQNARVVRAIRRPSGVFDVGWSPDQRVIWMFAATAAKGRPQTHVVVTDICGRVIHRSTVREAGQIAVTYRGRSYRVDVPEPRLPD